MSVAPTIVSAAVVDVHGIASSAGWHARWADLGVEGPGNGISFRALFGRSDATFRRLDRMTRALVVAVEACALEAHLTEEQREATGLVVETVCGSVELDLAYTRSLAQGVVRVSLFPYTLQSTCLGDVALRHGLCGPTSSLSIGPEDEGEALREARRMLARGELEHVVVGTVDALGEPVHGVEPVLRAVACLAVAPSATRAPVLSWREDGETPFAELASECRALARELRMPSVASVPEEPE